MAAYHLEALRRQRVIERQAEARLRLERQQSFVDKGVQTGDSPTHKKRSHKKKKKKGPSNAEKRADEVRRDLRKQEMVLRDSNLVMGHIPVTEEIKFRQGSI